MRGKRTSPILFTLNETGMPIRGTDRIFSKDFTVTPIPTTLDTSSSGSNPQTNHTFHDSDAATNGRNRLTCSDPKCSPRSQRPGTGKGGTMALSAYLDSGLNLSMGSVDDYGDAKYMRLHQNVPDGYVYDLQNDLRAMGFNDIGTPDGAFGEMTRKAVKQFQRLAKLPVGGAVDHITKNEIRIWLAHGYSKNAPPPGESPAAPEARNGVTLIRPRVPHFSQGDPRWASRTLGSHATIQRKGCAITSVAMILKFFGRNVTPGTLDEYLDSAGGYDGDSVKWTVAGRCGQTSQNKLSYSRKRDNPEELKALLAERVGINLPTMVRVDYGTDPDITYNHFVVCVGVTAQNEFVMNDPATREGDGYANLCDDNIIQRTHRKSGYRIVQLDWYGPVA